MADLTREKLDELWREFAEGVSEYEGEPAMSMRLLRAAGKALPTLLDMATRTLDAERKLEAELDAISGAIGTVRFMDPPDGGDVSLPEQVRRMRVALEYAEAVAEGLNVSLKQANKAATAAEARVAKLRDRLVDLYDDKPLPQIPGGADAASYGLGFSAGWDRAIAEALKEDKPSADVCSSTAEPSSLGTALHRAVWDDLASLREAVSTEGVRRIKSILKEEKP